MAVAQQDQGVVRCALWARAEGVDPIGTAGTFEGFMLVEWPLPWPRDIGDVPGLGPLVDALRGTGVRLQGLVPASTDGRCRVVHYRRGETGALVRAECAVAATDVAAAAVDLLRGETPPAADDGVAGDVLVCGHGSRDRCCGSFGTSLSMLLASDPGLLGPGIRHWRTSHLGGHRFAPNALVLPAATTWAYLDLDLLVRVVAMDGPVADLLPHYRGCATLGQRAQAVERSVLGEVGWPLMTMRRWADELEGGVVRLSVEQPDGGVRRWQAVVSERRQMPVPECGAPLDQATKSEPELAVHDFRPA